MLFDSCKLISNLILSFQKVLVIASFSFCSYWFNLKVDFINFDSSILLNSFRKTLYIRNINFQKYLINAKVTKNGSNNPTDFCNITICNDKQTFLLASLLITIKLGLTFYEENEKWGSESGGQIKTILGNGFRLYS